MRRWQIHCYLEIETIKYYADSVGNQIETP